MKLRSQTVSNWLWGMASIVLLALCGLVLFRSWTRQQGLRVGEPVPDFTLRDLNGGQINLHQLAGRTRLLLVFSAGCPSCQRSAPLMKQLHDTLAPRGVVVIGISLNAVPKTKEFVDHAGWTFPVVIGNRDLCVNQYRVRRIPALLLIDGSGILRYAAYGGMDDGHKLVEIVSHFMR